MKTFKGSRQFVVWAATLAMVFQPLGLTAAEQAPAATPPQTAAQVPVITDVALDAGGILHGQALDAGGKPLSSAQVVVANGRVERRATTNPQGWFQVAGLTGGVYRVQMERQAQLCRIWMPGTAPPSATAGLLVVQSDDLARGQSCTNCGDGVDCGTGVCAGRGALIKRALSNPFIFGGLVAAAIAIPVAIHNSNNDHGPSS